MTTKPHVVVVGSLNMDLVVRVAHMPAAGETILGSSFQNIPGGKGANQAVGAARLGARVTMIGRVGNDEFGKALTDNLKIEDVNIAHVSIADEEATGIALITLDQSGQNSIVVASGANMTLTPADVRSAWKNIDAIDIVVIPLEVPMDCIDETIRLAADSNVKVIVNPAPAQELSAESLKHIDVLVPNESETSLLTGLSVETIEKASAAAQNLLAKGIGAVVLTLGSRGALLVSKNQSARLLPAYQVNVVDTTAAGDAFVAALSVGISSGLALEDAVQQANAAGALATTRMGAQPCMPAQNELTEFMKQPGGEQ